MWFIRLHEQNWDNLLLLIFSLSLSVAGSVISNISNDKRSHNVSRLFNELLSRTNLVFAVFFITLSTLRISNDVGEKLLKASIGISFMVWAISLLVANHVNQVRLPSLHTCNKKGNGKMCDVAPTSWEILWISKWNILLFGSLAVYTVLIALSKWACGPQCE